MCKSMIIILALEYCHLGGLSLVFLFISFVFVLLLELCISNEVSVPEQLALTMDLAGGEVMVVGDC